MEALLEKEKFNFDLVVGQFNKIVSELNKKMMRGGRKFEVREL